MSNLCEHAYHKTGFCEWVLDKVTRIYHIFECSKCKHIDERQIK